jgi:hypothetical protein
MSRRLSAATSHVACQLPGTGGAPDRGRRYQPAKVSANRAIRVASPNRPATQARSISWVTRAYMAGK